MNIEKEYEEVAKFLFSIPKESVFSSSIEERDRRHHIRTLFYKKWIENEASNLRNKEIFHIAGTKGKGSVCAILENCFRSTGKKTGLFISPHLHTLRERIRINGELISISSLIEITNKIKFYLNKDDLNERIPNFFSFFDKILLIALTYFSEQNVDIIVLETGLGGRFDSTNFFEKPTACIITSISYDHQSILGETLDKIAWEKAGIIKNKVPIFTPNSQTKEVLEVFEQEAREKDAKLIIVDSNKCGDFISKLSLEGDFQKENLSLVLEVIDYYFKNDISKYFAYESIKNVYWPCRFEIFDIDGKILVIDGAHNENSIEKLLDYTKNRFPNKKIWVLFGAGNENWQKMLKIICELSEKIILVQSSHFKATKISCMKEIIEEMNYFEKIFNKNQDNSSIKHNLLEVLKYIDKEKVFIICGSLFTAAEARNCLYNEKLVEFHENDWVRYSDNFLIGPYK